MFRRALTSRIGKRVAFGRNVKIYPNVVIEDGVHIGDNTVIYPGAYIGKAPGGNLTRKPNPHGVDVYVGPNCQIGPGSIIYQNVNLKWNVLIGDNVSVRENVHIGENTILGRNTTVNYDTTIGSNVRIMDGSHITGNSVVEDDVFISCLVATTNDNNMNTEVYDDVFQRGPIFRKGCRVGGGATILPNVVIGEKAVIGAGSVVTKSIPGHVVALGSPARIKEVLLPINELFECKDE